jgi:hypothetical protein
MREEWKDVAVWTPSCEGGTEKVWGVRDDQRSGAEVGRVGWGEDWALGFVGLWMGRRGRIVEIRWVCGGLVGVVALEVVVAKGYWVVNYIILGGAIAVLDQVDALTPTRESADVGLNDEGRAVVELRRMGKLKSG